MPLLHIIGTTSFNTSFSVAFAFLRHEREHDYQCALENIIGLFSDRLPVTITTDRELALMNSIETLLPNMAHLLCVWHVQKNVLNNCRKYFGSEDDWAKFLSAWTKIIESPSTQSYEENVEKLWEVYVSLPVMLKYISETWLIYKEKFVHAYTNNYFHFGDLTSSRAEGMHHMIKSYIQVSTCELRDAHARICQAIQAQVANHSALLSQERMRVFHKHRIALFTHVVRHVSTFALNKVLEQYNLIQEPSDRACAQVLKNTMGLPCQHRIQYLQENNEPLTVNEFHPIWRLDVVGQEPVAVVQRAISPILQAVRERYESLGPFQQHQTMEQLNQLALLNPPPINNPSVQQSRGRPSGSTASRPRQSRGVTVWRPGYCL
ncbi:hypothetical protein K3495_g14210 [Podosphaera aphanis]|nr:hypothetical protein K3495_g14210 [Podosphaera aphanis]